MTLKIGIATASISQLPHVTLKDGALNQQEPLDFGKTSRSLDHYDWTIGNMVIENLLAVLGTLESESDFLTLTAACAWCLYISGFSFSL